MTDQWNELQRQQMAEVERMRGQAQQQPPNEPQQYDSNYRPPYYRQQPQWSGQRQPQQPPNYGQPPQQPQWQPNGQAQVTRVVTAKNPAVAGLLSFFWPGLGHVYAGIAAQRAVPDAAADAAHLVPRSHGRGTAAGHPAVDSLDRLRRARGQGLQPPQRH
jgi:hypothetical protein